MDQPDPPSAPVRPRFFAASLSDYNNGILHGEWIDASIDAAEMGAAVGAMLERSPTYEQLGEPAEEWVILDSEGFGERLDAMTPIRDVVVACTGPAHLNGATIQRLGQPQRHLGHSGRPDGS